MHNYQDLFFASIYSQLNRLKIEAKHLRRSSKIKHHEALNRIAASLGCRDWQHLCYVTEQAREAHLLRICGRNFTELENSMLYEMELKTLCQERPDIALIAIEELAIDLFQGIFETLRSPSLFAERAANFGDLGVTWDDTNTPGWRLNVDIPQGHLFYGQYPAPGKMIALIDGSVSGDVINDHLDADPEADEESVIAKARENYRGFGDIFLYGQAPEPQEATPNLSEACYAAVMTSVEDQCGITLEVSE